jgi:hypothetical protein
MLTRRDLIGKVAAGATVVFAGGVARASYRAVEHELSAPQGAPSEGWQQANEPVAAVERSDAQPSTSNPSAPDVAATDAAAAASAPPPWELIRPLELGSVVGYGWRVAGLSGAVDGSAVLTLQNRRGRTHRVHICRNDGNPQGLVYTRRFDLVVMNGGRGDLPTEEKFARVVAEVAHVLASNEVDPRQGAVVAALLPQAERQRLFSDSRLR